MSYRTMPGMPLSRTGNAARKARADTGSDTGTRPIARSRVATFCRACLSGGVPRRSLFVALVVGTALNLINSGPALFGGGHIDVATAIMNYIVPYCVATYGAVSLRLGTGRSRTRARPAIPRPAAASAHPPGPPETTTPWPDRAASGQASSIRISPSRSTR